MEPIEPKATDSIGHSSFFNLFYSKNEGAGSEAAEALETAEVRLRATSCCGGLVLIWASGTG